MTIIDNHAGAAEDRADVIAAGAALAAVEDSVKSEELTMVRTTAFLSLGSLILAAALLSSCAKPEGPAARLGRSIDEISDSLGDLSDDWTAKDRERALQEKNRVDNSRDYYRDREIPDHDPYYDSPPRETEAEREERLRRERRDDYSRPERY
jgi:hypothetical protein